MKNLTILSVILFFQLTYSQIKLEDNSSIVKAVKLEKIDNSKFDYINDAVITWDFSSIDIAHKSILIEVISIFDCFNNENASDFKEHFSILNLDNFSLKGVYHLNHVELMTKCFKWRIVVKERNKEQFSDWSYFMFLK